MSGIGRLSLTHEEASLLLQCGYFWPDSMVDKGSFMKMLRHILDVEAETDIQTERREEELAASGACNARGVVDVKHYVSREMWKSIGRVAILRMLAQSKLEDELLAATRFAVPHGAVWPAPTDHPTNATLATALQGAHKGIIFNPDR
eukprot:2435898-Amphidinium_carterae.1